MQDGSPSLVRGVWTLAERIAFVCILALATFLRLWPIGSALPYIDYIDEGHVLHQVMRVLHEHTYDTRLYDYGSVPSYLIAGATMAYAPVYQQLRGRSFWDDLPTRAALDVPLGEIYDLISPPDFIVIGRGVVALCSIGTVLLARWLARQLNGRLTALIAMLLVAACPALVSRSSIVIVDTVAAFFTMAALCFALRLQRAVSDDEPSAWRYAAFAGLACGLAAASKYPAGAVFAAVIATILTLPLRLATKAAFVAISGAGLFVGSVAGMPALVMKPGTIVGTWLYLVRSYDEISLGNYWRSAISFHELGIPLLVAATFGFVAMWRMGGTARQVAISWLAFAGLLLGAIVWSAFQPFRNVTALVPLVCIAAAFGLVQLQRVIGARAIASVLAMLLAGSLLIPTLLDISERKARVDTRVLAIDWLRQNTASDARIIGLQEVGILPSEWNRLGRTTRVVPWAEALATTNHEPFDYLVTGVIDLREAQDLPKWTEYRDRWNANASRFAVAADFGVIPTFLIPFFWRTNDEHIVILRARP